MQQQATATRAEAVAYNQEVFLYHFVVSYKAGKKSKTFLADQQRELDKYDQKYGRPVPPRAAEMALAASTGPAASTKRAAPTKPAASTAFDAVT
jgi:hypothetical protein